MNEHIAFVLFCVVALLQSFVVNLRLQRQLDNAMKLLASEGYRQFAASRAYEIRSENPPEEKPVDLEQELYNRAIEDPMSGA